VVRPALPQHPNQYDPQGPTLLTIDQELGEGASLGVPPVPADRIPPIEVREHQYVEELGAGSRTERVEAIPERRRSSSSGLIGGA
jgi:hypothetical protein